MSTPTDAQMGAIVQIADDPKNPPSPNVVANLKRDGWLAVGGDAFSPVLTLTPPAVRELPRFRVFHRVNLIPTTGGQTLIRIAIRQAGDTAREWYAAVERVARALYTQADKAAAQRVLEAIRAYQLHQERPEPDNPEESEPDSRYGHTPYWRR